MENIKDLIKYYKDLIKEITKYRKNLIREIKQLKLTDTYSEEIEDKARAIKEFEIMTREYEMFVRKLED